MTKSKLKTALANAKRDGWDKYIKSEADEHAVLNGHYFDEQEAQRTVSFFETFLKHTMGAHAGKPFKLLDWQADDIISPLFGWKQENGLRRYAKGDVFVAKKQGKSTVAAALVNLFLITAGRRAECYGVAHTRDQAGIIFREAAAMAESSTALSKRLKVLNSKKRIVYGSTSSFYQALAGESCARGVEGINPVLVLIDEIHVQRSRVLYDGLAYASAARPNSLMLSVSTVGLADKTSIWWEQYEYAKGILDGSLHDDSRFAYIRQADPECHDDFNLCGELEQWEKAMPSLGHTVTEAKIKQAWVEAKNSPAKQNAFRRYLLNIPTSTLDRVVNMSSWYAGEMEPPNLDGCVCYGGLDLASKEDLSSFCLYFPADGERPAYVLCWSFCPSDKIKEREEKGYGHYDQWRREGFLTVAGEKRLDHEVVKNFIREAVGTYDVREIGFDVWGADAVVPTLIQEGVEMVAVSQGLRAMTPGTRALLDDIEKESIYHDGNPVLSWCLSNCAADESPDSSGGIKFSKKKSADKIDCAVALSMARGRALYTDGEKQTPDIFF